MNQTSKKVVTKVPLKNKNQNELTKGCAFENLDRTNKQIDHEQSKKPLNNPLRLLIGKIVFLDINNSYKVLNKVKECMKLINAKIADCLSKDVNYVITNRGQNNDTFQSSEVIDHEKKIKTSPNTINFLSRSNSLINRTQAILEKASKGNPSTDILATARRLGIRVFNLNELEKYIEKFTNKKRSLEDEDKVNFSKNFDDEANRETGLSQSLTHTGNHKIYKIKNDFIKFESICKQYKPIYQEFDCWHELNFEIIQNKSTYSPFQCYFSDDNGSSNCSSTRNEQKNRQSEDSMDQIQQSSFNKFKSPNSSTLTKGSSKTNLIAKETVNRFQSNRVYSFSVNLKVQSNSQQNYLAKKKSTGYCECCKQRYDNLKKHLNSAQHDTFERNQSNFKEIDSYITGILNFNQFLIKNDLLVEEEIQENHDMDEMKQFVKNFMQNKTRLGITNNQIVEAFNVEFKDPILTQAAISKFEQLDITPRSSAKVRPVLEILMNNSKLKFGDRLKSFPDIDSKKKKRKRDCTFSDNSLNILNDKFNQNPIPNDTEIFRLANQINYDEEMIKTWFNEKRQISKQNYSVKKFKKTNVVDALSLFENSSCSDQSPSSLDHNHTDNDDKKKALNLKMDPKKKKKIENQLKQTTPFVSSFSISSPPAAALFSHQNSFSHPTDTVIGGSLNTPSQNSSLTTKLLASKVDFMSGNTEVQTIKSINEEKSLIALKNDNIIKSENSTDLSCIDDVVLSAFVNDFSYEIVHK